jgi:heterotetrameric sarcosine oxidase gamma subunit
MLERHTPFANATLEREGLSLREDAGFELTHYAGATVSLRRELGEVPDFGQATAMGGKTLFRVGAGEVMLLGSRIETRLCQANALSAARARIRISGQRAREFVQALFPIDCAETAFGKGAVALTGLHHVPAMIHALGGGEFHIYLQRTFARSIWDWMVDAAGGLA